MNISSGELLIDFLKSLYTSRVNDACLPHHPCAPAEARSQYLPVPRGTLYHWAMAPLKIMWVPIQTNANPWIHINSKVRTGALGKRKSPVCMQHLLKFCSMKTPQGPHLLLYLYSHGIPMQWSIRKMWQIFPNERHWSHDGKIHIGFSTFLGVFQRSSINMRIEVNFCSFALGKWKDTGRMSTIEKHLVSHKIYTWPVPFHFPMETKRVYYNP